MTTQERLDELLALEATQGLTPAEAAQLGALLALFPDEDRAATELTVAALDRALSGPPEALPAHLAEQLELTAVAFFARAAEPPPARIDWRPKLAWSGWAVAAVLGGFLAFNLASRGPRPAELEQALQKAQERQWVLERELASAREALPRGVPLGVDREALRQGGAATFAGEKGGAAGEVVWSTAKQEGYLEVHGLTALDPAREQYQLWIVDPAHKEPVDGGVFDVKPDGSALVPVRHPIRVTDAKLFAVTKEAAGGVVVSKRPDFELVLKPKQG